MIDYFKVITITHHVIDVSEIDAYVVKTDGDVPIAQKLAAIKSSLDIEELCYLSTCNRVSYMLYMEAELDLDFIKRFFDLVNPQLHLMDEGHLTSLVSVYEGMEAIQNIFEVACSVDSMVVGEREIYRQFRDAIAFSKEHGLTGDNFRMIDRATVETAKRVYATTRIGEKPLSIAALAMDSLLAFQPDKSCKVVFLGAGETNQLLGKFFKRHLFERFVVFNRTLSRAQEMAESLQGEAFEMSQLAEVLDDFDVLVVCTASTQPIVDVETFRKIGSKNTDQKIVIDLSVPCNIHKQVFEQFQFNFINIDELKVLAEKNLAFRKQEISLAKEVIHQSLPIFRNIYQQRQLERALADLPKEIKKVKQKAIEEVFSDRMAKLDEPAKQLVLDMMDYFEKKSISIPMKTAKKAFELDEH
ncbi:MAG: glutamyl-tRNA reductase [Saprospiraceae bacterium]|nr:glutamyl-tRNA reductase [Saprospiraceae bacterium]